MRALLGCAGALEAATALALLVHPRLLTQPLLGADITGAGVPVGRVLGFALLALAVACWPFPTTAEAARAPLRALGLYNALITAYLVYVGVSGEWPGFLLWPAAVAHAVLALLLLRAWLAPRTG